MGGRPVPLPRQPLSDRERLVPAAADSQLVPSGVNLFQTLFIYFLYFFYLFSSQVKGERDFQSLGLPAAGAHAVSCECGAAVRHENVNKQNRPTWTIPGRVSGSDYSPSESHMMPVSSLGEPCNRVTCWLCRPWMSPATQASLSCPQSDLIK